MERRSAQRDDEGGEIEVGRVELSGEFDHDLARPVLWIPDPEQERGWRELYCRRPQPKPNGKGLGF